ncbi:hypothetical protein CbuK_1667 [Coxiella burnetii CbuK_Q154]|nr:hypothetical protein CbuG_1614 [Coxiella burnetii CbuG_Q212]ACJ20810.1 hypothetical protein CbuK_1667 [Coxiella burnetii CbuK_Q154]
MIFISREGNFLKN